MIITEHLAKEAMIEAGYLISELQAINEGSNHYVFKVDLVSGEKIICKFVKLRDGEEFDPNALYDTMFHGLLSLEREVSLFKIARDAGLAAPQVYGIHDSSVGQFIVLERMPGISFTQFIKNHDYRESYVMNAIEYLAQDMAKLHQRSFVSYGNLMSEESVEPCGITNYKDYFFDIALNHVQRAHEARMLDDDEVKRYSTFINQRFDDFKDCLSIEKYPPVMAFTDLHGENFFVDETGKPSGFFDLESSQAACAALEFYGFRFFLFSMFDHETYEKLDAHFFSSYTLAKGPYAPTCLHESEYIDFMSALRLLELAQSYWGHVDGIRDSWGMRFKQLFIDYMETHLIAYEKIGDIFRDRDHQPKQLN